MLNRFFFSIHILLKKFMTFLAPVSFFLKQNFATIFVHPPSPTHFSSLLVLLIMVFLFIFNRNTVFHHNICIFRKLETKYDAQSKNEKKKVRGCGNFDPHDKLCLKLFRLFPRWIPKRIGMVVTPNVICLAMVLEETRLQQTIFNRPVELEYFIEVAPQTCDVGISRWMFFLSLLFS